LEGGGYNILVGETETNLETLR